MNCKSKYLTHNAGIGIFNTSEKQKRNSISDKINSKKFHLKKTHNT